MNALDSNYGTFCICSYCVIILTTNNKYYFKRHLMIKLYYHPSPNPLKVALYLEETGVPYELVPIDTRKGEQHSAEFKAINPNAKTPAMTDDGVRIFDSNAMMIYLAEKTGQYVPENKAEMYSSLFVRRCCI